MPISCHRKQALLAALLGVCLILTACQPAGSLPPLSEQARVLAFGDSLTFGYGVSNEHAYPSVLSKLIDREVINAGISGELSSEGLKRLPRLLKLWQPELVIICHGGNDILRRMDARATERNLKEMVRLVRASGASVVLVAVPKIGLIPQAARLYGSVGDDMSVPVEKKILPELALDSSMKSDQVHLNQQGYKAMALAIAALLEKEGSI